MIANSLISFSIFARSVLNAMPIGCMCIFTGGYLYFFIYPRLAHGHGWVQCTVTSVIASTSNHRSASPAHSTCSVIASPNTSPNADQSPTA